MEEKKTRKGFASWDKDKLREAARKGGLSIPGHKRTFSTDNDLAKRAGRLGGAAPRKKEKE